MRHLGVHSWSKWLHGVYAALLGTLNCNWLGKGLAYGALSVFPLDKTLTGLLSNLLASQQAAQSLCSRALLLGMQGWPAVFCRWEDPTGHAGAELPAPEAASPDQLWLYHKGRAPGLSGGEASPLPFPMGPGEWKRSEVRPERSPTPFHLSGRKLLSAGTYLKG